LTWSYHAVLHQKHQTHALAKSRHLHHNYTVCMAQEHTISPQATACLYSPLLSSPVRNPSLPATSSRQSCAISRHMDPASPACVPCTPHCMHLPTLCLRSASQRGFSDAVTGLASSSVASFVGVDENPRAMGRDGGVRAGAGGRMRDACCRRHAGRMSGNNRMLQVVD